MKDYTPIKSNNDVNDKKLQKNAIDKQFNRLWLNINHLRELYGETKEQLAEAIGISYNAIASYENRARIPRRNELIMIAKHYQVTVHSLLYNDFSNNFIETDILINDKSNRELIFCTLLPIVYTDEDLENKNFKTAFDLHNNIYQALCKDDINYALQNIDICTQLYRKAAEEDIISARANLLWWPMYLCIGEKSLNKEIKDSSELLKSDATAGDVFKSCYLIDINDLSDEDWEKWFNNQPEKIESYIKDIIINLYLLKTTHDLALCELADYYIAIGYMFNILGNDRLTKEQSREIGEEMLRFCNLMRNPYAEKYYSVFLDPENYIEVE